MIDGKIFQNDILLGKWLELLDDLLLSFYTNFAGESEQILKEKEEFDDDLTKEHLNRLALLCDDNVWPAGAFKRICCKFSLNVFERFCLVISFAFKNDYDIRQSILSLQDSRYGVLFLDFCYEIFGFYFGGGYKQNIREEPLILSIFGIHPEQGQKTLSINKFVDAYIKGKEITDENTYFWGADEKVFELPIRESLKTYIVNLGKQKPKGKNILLLCGAKLSGKHTQIGLLAAQNSAKLLIVNFEFLNTFEKNELKAAAYEICLEAILNDAWLCFEGLKLKEDEEKLNFKYVINVISKYIEFFVVICEGNLDLISCAQGYVATKFLMQPLLRKTSIDCWKYFFERANISFRDFEMLSRNFSFNIGQIALAAKQLGLLGAPNLREEQVLSVCRQAAGENFGTKAKRINKIFSWNDLIINKECEDLLHWICDLVKFSSVVYDDLGFARKTAYGRSVSALFYGPPGTGKTMAAQVVANELGQDLYKVDLSQMISKYIGETEKNLNAVFDAAGRANVVLFFDEADSLFSKRTQVTNSNDKFANNETSFLLQKIEEYSGVAILATNLAVNFDSAFKRRIKVMVNFTLPDANLRRKLWRSVFPQEVDVSAIDFEYLAEKFEISGSMIKTSAVAATFLAVREGSKPLMKHIMQALKAEMNKNGNLILENDFNI